MPEIKAMVKEAVTLWEVTHIESKASQSVDAKKNEKNGKVKVSNERLDESSKESYKFDVFVPVLSETKNRMYDELGFPTSKYVTPICDSAGNALQQKEEMEALSYIFNDSEMTVVRNPPSQVGDPTAMYLIRVGCSTMSPTTKRASDWIAHAAVDVDTIFNKWCGNLKLIFDLTGKYPSEDCPIIELVWGDLSLADFSVEIELALLSCMVRIQK
jgi:hypothetical protein